jgi:hypothetical protein
MDIMDMMQSNLDEFNKMREEVKNMSTYVEP